MGLDVSSWQHPAAKPIEWDAVRGAGYTFVIIKATQGATYLNPWLKRDAEDAYAEGLLVGAYHFYEAGTDPGAQSAHFKTYVAELHLDLGCWLDFEVAPVAQWTMAGWVNGFIEGCKPELDKVGLYCGVDMWLELKGANVAPSGLWAAYDADATPPAGVTIQQIGWAIVPGVPADVDTDRLLTNRAINLPTTPGPRPSAQTVHSVVPADDDKALEAPAEASA